MSEETKSKISKSQKGKRVREKSSAWGRRWITNGIEDKFIKGNEEIPSGFYYGRIWNNKLKK